MFFLNASVVTASVVINEVFPNPSGDSSESTEFIELFNTDPKNDIDISGFALEEAKVFTLSGVIGSLNYMSFTREETGLALNNSGDTIVLKNASGEIIDAFTFESTEEDASWSRYPDGNGEYFLTKTVTKDSPNTPPPTPTSTPDPTPFPTTPVSLSPTFTPIPTRTKTPTVSPTSTPISLPSNTHESDTSTFVLSKTVDVSTDEEPEEKVETQRFPFTALFFITAGVVFIASALYLKFKNQNRDTITYDS